MKLVTNIAMIIATAIILIGCGPAQDGSNAKLSQESSTQALPKGKITGSVSYRERMALSTTATLSLQLQDVSLADVAAEIIAELTMINPGQVPINFALEYDRSLIDDRHSYSMRAVISDGDQMLFTNDASYPVLTRGFGDLAIMTLVRTSSGAKQSIGTALTETRWQLAAISGEPVLADPTGRSAYLQLSTENEAVQGFSGCNQFNGRWSLENERIVLGALAMTMMACADEMNTEQVFMQALEEQNRHEIVGNELRMYKDNELVLQFDATN